MSDEIKCVYIDSRGRKVAYTEAELTAEDPANSDQFAKMDELFGGRVGGMYTARDGEPLAGLDMMRRELINSVFKLGEMDRAELNPTPTNAHALGMLCAEVWGGWDNDKVSRTLVRDLAAEIIRNEVGTGDTFDTTGLDQLESALRPKLADYWHAVSNPPDDAPEGISWPDAALCELLRGIGDTGKAYADGGEKAARARFGTNPYAMFFDWSVPGLARYPKALATALWLDVVKPQIERERAAAKRAERNPPGLAIVTLGQIADLAWTKGNRIQHNPNQLSLLSEDDLLVAQTDHLPSAHLRAIIEHGTADMRTMTFNRLFRHLMTIVTEQAFDPANRNPTFIQFEGGISALAESIGATSNRDRATLQRIITAGQSWHVEWTGGAIGGLWTYHQDDKSGPGRSAFLELRLGAALAPFYSRTQLARGQRNMTPIPPEAALINPRRYYAEQANFQLLLTSKIAEGRLDIADNGGALITPRDLKHMAKRIGLPQATLPRLMDRWTQDGDDGEAFIEQVDRDRYHIADNETFGRSRAFIDDGADRSKSARKGGRAKARKQRISKGKGSK